MQKCQGETKCTCLQGRFMMLSLEIPNNLSLPFKSWFGFTVLLLIMNNNEFYDEGILILYF